MGWDASNSQEQTERATEPPQPLQSDNASSMIRAGWGAACCWAASGAAENRAVNSRTPHATRTHSITRGANCPKEMVQDGSAHMAAAGHSCVCTHPEAQCVPACVGLQALPETHHRGTQARRRQQVAVSSTPQALVNQKNLDAPRRGSGKWHWSMKSQGSTSGRPQCPAKQKEEQQPYIRATARDTRTFQTCSCAARTHPCSPQQYPDHSLHQPIQKLLCPHASLHQGCGNPRPQHLARPAGRDAAAVPGLTPKLFQHRCLQFCLQQVLELKAQAAAASSSSSSSSSSRACSASVLHT